MTRSIALVVTLVMLLTAASSDAAKSKKKEPTTEPSAGATDSLQVGTEWRGTEKGGTGKRAQTARAATVKVLKREGDAFQLNYWVREEDGRRGVELEGQVRGNEVRAKITKVLPGGDWKETVLDDVWNGTLNGDVLTFTRESSHGAELTSELKVKK
jgi:opacity protein-like surface antigen